MFFFLQASKGSLHRAAVSGEHETVSETEYVDLSDLSDLSDEVLVFQFM